MSKIFENKSMLIHVAAEIIVVIGITFYFSQKNKKLMGHINDLIQRIEDQEDIIQKHEQLINNLTNAINDINSKLNNNINMNTEKHIDVNDMLKNINKAPYIIPSMPTLDPNSLSNKSVSFNPKVEEKVEEIEEEVEETEEELQDTNEDLDAELEEELNDLK
jgi:phage shock protein A